jgi:hypothetical protein
MLARDKFVGIEDRTEEVRSQSERVLARRSMTIKHSDFTGARTKAGV